MFQIGDEVVFYLLERIAYIRLLKFHFVATFGHKKI